MSILTSYRAYHPVCTVSLSLFCALILLDSEGLTGPNVYIIPVRPSASVRDCNRMFRPPIPRSRIGAMWITLLTGIFFAIESVVLIRAEWIATVVYLLCIEILITIGGMAPLFFRGPVPAEVIVL